uniref:ARID domain-containing protein n=1 Tax=Petromyzon marinus TaxID=7757 RepID=S4RM85_PETMA
QTMNEPAYLLVGTDVSAKYRGAFCEAKIKSVKKLVKVKKSMTVSWFKQDSSSHVVQDDQIKGCLRIGAAVEIRMSDGTLQEGMISKLTDASWYTVVFDDGDETVLRRSSLRLKGERHFAKSESLDQLPLTHPEHFGTPVLGRKSVKGRRSGLTAGDEKEVAEWSEEDEAERVVADDGTVGHVVCVESSADDKMKGYPLFPALVVSPDCNDEVTVRRDQCLVRSFKDGTFHCVARKDIRVMDRESFPKPEAALKQAFEDALGFLESKESPASWKKDLSSVHQDDSGSESGGDEQTVEHEEEEEAEDESDPEERDNFLQQLYQFMENRGTPINRPPVLCYRRLNLFKLYRLVQKRGGSTGIKSGTTWKQVYKELGVPVLNSAASHNIKSTYRKYLFGFEEYCRSVRIRFRSVEYAMEAEGRQVGRRTARRREAPAPQPDPEEPSAADEAPMSDKREATTTRRRTKASAATVASEEECSDEGAEKKEEEEMDVGNAAAVEEESDKKEEESGIKEEPDGQTVAAVVAATAPVEEMEKLVEVEENDERMETDDEDREEDDDEADDDMEDDDGDEMDSDGADDLEGYPLGTRLQVKYGRGKTLKVYEASIRKRGVEAGEIIYLVHYFGWN